MVAQLPSNFELFASDLLFEIYLVLAIWFLVLCVLRISKFKYSNFDRFDTYYWVLPLHFLFRIRGYSFLGLKLPIC